MYLPNYILGKFAMCGGVHMSYSCAAIGGGVLKSRLDHGFQLASDLPCLGLHRRMGYSEKNRVSCCVAVVG